MNIIDLPDYIQSALVRVVEDAGFLNYRIHLKNGSFAGDGFLSELICTTIIEQTNGFDTERKLNLLCKLPPFNENRRKEFFGDVVFRREAYFYNKLLPAYMAFQREKNIPDDDLFRAPAKCYLALDDEKSENYAIIMEDLRSKGFRMWNKAKPTTIDNIRLVLREIGKFHGISFALKDQKPDIFEEFQQLKDVSSDFFKSPKMQGMFKSCFQRAIDALHSNRHKDVISKLEANTLAYFELCLDEKASKDFGVISHGDLWNNNIMYRFNEENIPDDVRFVDWQIIRYVSPAIDLSYNIFTSTDKPLRDAEYINLLKHYYQSLSRTIELLGSVPNELFTFDNLLDEMKKCGTFALLITPMILQISLADSSQITDLNEMCDQIADGNLNQDLIKGLTDNAHEEYATRLNDAIGDLLNLGYFKEIK